MAEPNRIAVVNGRRTASTPTSKPRTSSRTMLRSIRATVPGEPPSAGSSVSPGMSVLIKPAGRLAQHHRALPKRHLRGQTESVRGGLSEEGAVRFREPPEMPEAVLQSDI